MSVFGVILLLVAAFLTIGVAANTGQLHASDAAGNGMADAFAWFCAIADWLVLAVLLLVAAGRGAFPRFSGIAMAFAFVLAIVGQVTALQILSASKVEGPAGALLQMVTWVAPALVMVRAVWGSWLPIVLLVLIALVPFPFRSHRAAPNAAALRQESDERQKAQDELRVNDLLQKIEALPRDSSLFAAIPLCADSNPAVREAARAKARTFVNRQADGEAYLAQSHDATLRELPNFDLRASPSICASAKKRLAAKASIKPFDNDPVRIEDAEVEVAPYIETMRWLLAHGCDCKPEISAIETAVARYAASPRRDKILAGLAAARGSR